MLKLKVVKEPIDQSWSIKRIAEEAIPIGWESVFESAKKEISDVSDVLDDQEILYGSYYPLKKDIFAAFNITQLKNVKVVIVGEDPYQKSVSINGKNVPRATGLAFSVRREDSIPSSLENIYKELRNTVHGFKTPDHGDLRQWARQGVLLLNTCLTVRPRQPGSHGDIWLGFLSKVFKAIAIENPSCIYLLWGREAHKIKPMLGERSIILEAMRPSGMNTKRGFFGCNHFNIANNKLLEQGKSSINWRIGTIKELSTTTKIPINVHRTSSFNPNLSPVDVNNFHMLSVSPKSNNKNPLENSEQQALPIHTTKTPENNTQYCPVNNSQYFPANAFASPVKNLNQITGLPIINSVI